MFRIILNFRFWIIKLLLVIFLLWLIFWRNLWGR